MSFAPSPMVRVIREDGSKSARRTTLRRTHLRLAGDPCRRLGNRRTDPLLFFPWYGLARQYSVSLVELLLPSLCRFGWRIAAFRCSSRSRSSHGGLNTTESA